MQNSRIRQILNCKKKDLTRVPKRSKINLVQSYRVISEADTKSAMQAWRNWQTRTVQVRVKVPSWRFESSCLHQKSQNLVKLDSGIFLYWSKRTRTCKGANVARQSGGLSCHERPKPPVRGGAGRQIYEAKMRSPLAQLKSKSGSSTRTCKGRPRKKRLRWSVFTSLVRVQYVWGDEETAGRQQKIHPLEGGRIDRES